MRFFVALLLSVTLAPCANVSVSGAPPIAQNGDLRGMDNDRDGYGESSHVQSYYRKDGTYVRGHYRLNTRDAAKTHAYQNNSLRGPAKSQGRRR